MASFSPAQSLPIAGGMCRLQDAVQDPSRVPSPPAWRQLIANRKKKCDEVRPRCSDCRRLNLSCHWSPSPGSPSSAEPAHDLILEAARDPVPEFDPILASVRGDPVSPCSPAGLDVEMILGPVQSLDYGFNSHLHTDDDRSLFNHYVHIVARALSRSPTDSTQNPFLATLLPMAAASETLTSVILGLSGCHWRRVYPQIWDRALARQGRGI